MAGISQPRNNIIAAIFYRLHLIESYGTGIQRIIECYSNQSSQPLFNPAPTSFVVVLPKLTNNDKSMSDEEKVFDYLNNHKSITRKDVERIIGCSKFKAVNIINRLIENGNLIKKGSAKNITYELKSTD